MTTSLARHASTLIATVLLLGIAGSASAIGNQVRPAKDREMARFHAGQVHHGGSVPGLARAAVDSFNLYGGVRSDGSNDRRPEGMFQDADLAPLWQDWFGVDRTENPVYWHIDEFNAANLDPVANNRAVWSGVPAGQPGFATAPGYGNGWNDVMNWTGHTNPTLFTTVRLSFDYNLDVEPGYDFFLVEYDSAGAWIEWLAATGSNKEPDGSFVNEATFDETVLFTPLMYEGPDNTEIRMRLRVVSDGGWSDEDGHWPSRGAVQVDNIQVRFDGNPVVAPGGDGLATFEDIGGVDDTELWNPSPSVFAGDFGKVLADLRDIDPCRDNLGPQLGFVDDGTPPSNAQDGTGGTTSPNWSYGVRGAWTVNHSGGLSYGLIPLWNEVWSPPIEWDDPNSVEDDALAGGAFIRFSVWEHLPLPNGMFWSWSVRSAEAGVWGPWQDRGFVYYGDGGGVYNNVQFDVSDLLSANRDQVQIALGANDLAEYFEVPGGDSTPSPSFDNVSFWRYNLGGPAFALREIDMFQDSFPNSGSADPLDPAALSVRMDMAQDVNAGLANLPGDSMVVDIAAVDPGAELAAMPTLQWILDANPAFDAVRTLPVSASAAGTSARGWPQWTGSVAGDSVRNNGGATVAGRFFFDLPNDGPARAPYHSPEPAMFFPGDRIRYFLRAEDTLGQVTTLPADTIGFASGNEYPRPFTIRALPSIVDDGGGGFTQPEILVVNDFGHRGGENEWLYGLAMNGLEEDIDYDTYTVRGPSSIVSNGIGSSGAHGATAIQLADYSTLFYLAGDLASGLLSDGSNEGSNDKADDLDLLTQWHGQAGHRYAAYFGDYIASGLLESGNDGLTYLTSVLGAGYTDDSIRDEVGGQATPLVLPAQPEFATSYIAYGGCNAINEFDSITPLAGSVAGHSFSDRDGLVTYAPAASVWHARTEVISTQPYDRIDATFPYGFSFIYEPVAGRTIAMQARNQLIGELLGAFGQPSQPPTLTDAPASRRFRVIANVPNPFNPSTTIWFEAPDRGPVTVRVYNTRGEVVRVLHDGPVAAGRRSAVWHGDDARGNPVASGVYLYSVEGFGEHITGKMALVK